MTDRPRDRVRMRLWKEITPAVKPMPEVGD
jgi:hypothetical protein